MKTILISSDFGGEKTGGEIINTRICRHFKEKAEETQIIQLKDIPEFFRKSLLLSMLWFLFRLRGVKNAVIIESQGLAEYLLLLNIHQRIFKKNKIIAYVFHLFKHDKGHNLSWITLLAEKMLLKASHKIICLSESSKKDVMLEGIPPARVSVIPPGIDLMPGKKEKQFNSKPVKLLYVGNVVPRKGLIYLVKALSRLKNRDFLLDVAGRIDKDPEYFRQVEQAITERGLEDKIVFHGWKNRQEMQEFYAQADLFVLPSLWEGFGMVLLEAMAFGLPVISTNASAIPELIENGENGILVPPKNSTALAEAITELINSPELSIVFILQLCSAKTFFPDFLFFCRKKFFLRVFV